MNRDNAIDTKQITGTQIDLDRIIDEYVADLHHVLCFYSDMRSESLHELRKNGNGRKSVLKKTDPEILRILDECESLFTSKLQSPHRIKFHYKTLFDQDNTAFLDRIGEESSRIKKVKENVDNLHDDIIDSYFRRFMLSQVLLKDHMFGLSKQNIFDFRSYMRKQPHFGLVDVEKFSSVTGDTIEKNLQTECSVDQMKARLAASIGRYCGMVSIINSGMNVGMDNMVYMQGDGSVHIADDATSYVSAIAAMTAYIKLKQLVIADAITEGRITPFYDNLDSLEAYYPKSSLELTNLDSLLSSGYTKDCQYDQRYKVVKLKKGNKDERSKIKSKVMVHDDGRISLKFIAFGVYAKKIDVVLEYTKDACSLVHLDYSDQTKLATCSARQFKTYGSLQSFMFPHKIYAPGVGLGKNIFGDLEDRLNPLMIERDGRQEFNLAAIGGEALLETDRYIRANYEKILQAAKK